MRAAVAFGAAIATFTAYLAVWRQRRREAALDREFETFQDLISILPDSDVEKFFLSYRMLATLEPHQQFRRKRDACEAELERRKHRAAAAHGQ